MEMVARLGGMSRDEFDRSFYYYLEAPPEDRCYFFKGADWICMFRHVGKEEHADAPDDFWLILHLDNRSKDKKFSWFMNFLESSAYKLPYIAFQRDHKDKKGLRFYKWSQIRRLCDS